MPPPSARPQRRLGALRGLAQVPGDAVEVGEQLLGARGRLDDDQGVVPARPGAREQHPESPVYVGQPRPLDRAPQYAELMPEGQNSAALEVGVREVIRSDALGDLMRCSASGPCSVRCEDQAAKRLAALESMRRFDRELTAKANSCGEGFGFDRSQPLAWAG
jgi:hypothetical protein